MLVAGCFSLFFGLGCAAVTFVVAGLYFAAKGGPGMAAQPSATKARKQGGGLALVGIIGFFAILYLIGTSLPTKTTQKPVAPAAGNATQPNAEAARQIAALKEAAERGDATAQFNLGAIYRNGYLVPQDYAEAVKWLRRSAEQGFARAQGALGAMYYLGAGVPNDLAQALEWFRLAAANGDDVAQGFLGELYETGSGVPQDDFEAYRWYSRSAAQGNTNAIAALATIYPKVKAEFEDRFYEKYPDLKPYKTLLDSAAEKLKPSGHDASLEAVMEAYATAARQEIGRQQDPVPELKAAAERGDPSSQFNLGWRFETGNGVEQDYAKAAYWFQKAAEQGDPSAQNNLGTVFRDGLGVQQDTLQAYAMFWIAAEAGCTNAVLNRDRMEKSMSWPQWSDAMRRAESFKARIADH
jgi:TPR repeat protein